VRYFLTAENRRFLIFISSFGTAALNIGLNLLLIPRFGIIGAAWATFISYIMLLLPIVILFRMKHPD
jgi:Na+-driven multidrug efflux pump